MSRGHSGVFTVLAAMALLCVLATSSGAAAGDTTRVSVASDGTQANGYSLSPSISSDGRYVAFESEASNLVASDTNGGVRDIFVRDRQEGTTQLVSVDSSENQGSSGFSYLPSISASGRYVAFVSEAPNLGEGDGDTGSSRDVFVRDLQMGETDQVTVNKGGIDVNGAPPSISSDGRYVAFTSTANLVDGDVNGAVDVFVHDRDTGTTQLVSIDRFGDQMSGYQGSISANGRYVAFVSSSFYEVFVRDLVDQKTERVDVASSGTLADGDSFYPSISADGRYVAFNSGASNLVAGDTNSLPDVFVRDLVDQKTERVSVGDCGSQQEIWGSYTPPSISADGRYVAFNAGAPSLVRGDTNGLPDVFVRDRQAGTTQLVSVNSSGNLQTGGNTLNAPSISFEGRYVAFLSSATNLVQGDTNNAFDVFVHERGNATQPIDCIAPTTIASATVPNGTGTSLYTSGTPTNRNVTVSLNAQDNQGGTGIRNIRYSATGADAISEQTVTAANLPATFTIDAQGTTTISYFATDNAGNQETPAKTLTVKIDKSAPRVSTATPTGTGVARGTNAIATFSERMDPTSITTSTFKLFKCSSTTSTNCATQITNVTITRSTDRLKATLNPYGTSLTLLASTTKYKVVVTTGAKDEAGNLLDQNPSAVGNQQKVWYFTTGRS